MKKILIVMLAVIFSAGTSYANFQKGDLKKLVEKGSQAYKQLKQEKKKHSKKYTKEHSQKDKEKHAKKDKKKKVKKHLRKEKKEHSKRKRVSREKRCEFFKTKGYSNLYDRFQCKDFEPKESCGDGIVNGQEQCDDGNVMDGDGCSSACEVEGCQSLDYQTMQITDNLSNDTAPMINNNGTVAWNAVMPDNSRQVFYNKNLSSTQLTFGSLSNSQVQLNDNDTMVWVSRDGIDVKINMYDGAMKTIADNKTGRYAPQLNNNDQIVWGGLDPKGRQLVGDGDRIELFYFDGFSVTQITDNGCNDIAPKLNDNGEVVWSVPTNSQEGCTGTSSIEIFKYDGTITDQITVNSSMDYEADINNKGQVMYINAALDGIESLIMVNDVSKVKILEGQIQAFGAVYDTYNSYAFNSAGNMAWYGSSLLGIGIHYYNGIETILAVPGERSLDTIQINDNDIIVWSESNQVQDWEIMLYAKGSVIQLTNNNFDDLLPEINNQNEIVWQSYDGNDTEIFKAIPVCK